ncbi:MAG: diacylglycerol/polyprenol kinase family protein [Gemmatimonadales bacterium]
MAPTGRTVAAGPALVLRHELVRKSLHIATAIFPVAYSLGAPRRTLLPLLVAVVAIALAMETARRTSTAGRAAFDRLFGTLTRAHEKQSVTGATWLALSCLVAVALLRREAAVAALWCATVGDPMAGIAGRLWARASTVRSPEPGRKTLVGSLACATASFAGVWVLAGYALIPAVAIAVAATVAEALPVRLDDNIRVAGAAGIVAQLLA